MFSSDEKAVRIAEANARASETSVAQIAHNFLTLQVMPHLAGTCRCRKPERCRATARESVEFCARVMRMHGAVARTP